MADHILKYQDYDFRVVIVWLEHLYNLLGVKINMLLLTNKAELGTFEWWISGLMIDPLFFLNLLLKMLVLLLLLIFSSINWSELRISHSKIFSSG